MGIFPSGVGLFPPFCAPFSPRTSGLRIAPVPARIYGQRRFLAGRLLPRRGGGAGLRRKQGRSSFLFLCFASSLSRFLCPPHPWAEGHLAFAPGSAFPPLQQRWFGVQFLFQAKKSDLFLVFVFANPFPNPPRSNKASSCPWNCGGRLLVAFPPEEMLFPPCPGEQSPFFAPKWLFLDILFGPLWFWMIF